MASTYEKTKSTCLAAVAKAHSHNRSALAHAELQRCVQQLSTIEAVAPNQMLELAFRKQLEVLVAPGAGKREELARLIDLAIWCAQKGNLEPTAPFHLFEDIFESQTVDECEQLFGLLEDRSKELSKWTQVAGASGPKLRLLRMCNDLLRRMSRATNTAFCGRVLMFLTGALPLSERSGLNIQKVINLANATETETAPSDTDTTHTDGDTAVDWAFYRTFWSIQEFYRKPTLVFEKAANWLTMCKAMRDVFAAFNSHVFSQMDMYRKMSVQAQTVSQAASATTYLPEHEGAGMDIDGGNNPVAVEVGDGASGSESGSRPSAALQGPFVKYLTSSNLMKLQLRDPYFRRHTLVQIIILLRFLTAMLQTQIEDLRKAEEASSTKRSIVTTKGTKGGGSASVESSKGKESEKDGGGKRAATPTAAATASPRPTPPTREEARVAELSKLYETAMELLQRTPPDGETFAAQVAYVLSNERHWAQWKNAGCAAIEPKAAAAGAKKGGKQADAGTPAMSAPPKRRGARILGMPMPEDGHGKRGGIGIEQLWAGQTEEPKDHLAALQHPLSRPTVREYLTPMINEMREDEQIEEQYMLKNDKVYTWKGLRLMRREQLEYFSMLRETNLELCAKQMMEAEKPGKLDPSLDGSEEGSDSKGGASAVKKVATDVKKRKRQEESEGEDVKSDTETAIPKKIKPSGGKGQDDDTALSSVDPGDSEDAKSEAGEASEVASEEEKATGGSKRKRGEAIRMPEPEDPAGGDGIAVHALADAQDAHGETDGSSSVQQPRSELLEGLQPLACVLEELLRLSTPDVHAPEMLESLDSFIQIRDQYADGLLTEETHGPLGWAERVRCVRLIRAGCHLLLSRVSSALLDSLSHMSDPTGKDCSIHIVACLVAARSLQWSGWYGLHGRAGEGGSVRGVWGDPVKKDDNHIHIGGTAPGESDGTLHADAKTVEANAIRPLLCIPAADVVRLSHLRSRGLAMRVWDWDPQSAQACVSPSVGPSDGSQSRDVQPPAVGQCQAHKVMYCDECLNACLTEEVEALSQAACRVQQLWHPSSELHTSGAIPPVELQGPAPSILLRHGACDDDDAWDMISDGPALDGEESDPPSSITALKSFFAARVTRASERGDEVSSTYALGLGGAIGRDGERSAALSHLGPGQQAYAVALIDRLGAMAPALRLYRDTVLSAALPVSGQKPREAIGSDALSVGDERHDIASSSPAQCVAREAAMSCMWSSLFREACRLRQKETLKTTVPSDGQIPSTSQPLKSPAHTDDDDVMNHGSLTDSTCYSPATPYTSALIQAFCGISSFVPSVGGAPSNSDQPQSRSPPTPARSLTHCSLMRPYASTCLCSPARVNTPNDAARAGHSDSSGAVGSCMQRPAMPAWATDWCACQALGRCCDGLSQFISWAWTIAAAFPAGWSLDQMYHLHNDISQILNFFTVLLDALESESSLPLPRNVPGHYHLVAVHDAVHVLLQLRGRLTESIEKECSKSAIESWKRSKSVENLHATLMAPAAAAIQNLCPHSRQPLLRSFATVCGNVLQSGRNGNLLVSQLQALVLNSSYLNGSDVPALKWLFTSLGAVDP